ncbi:MAG: F0F1 ATP synthase subunit gamma [Candidatus Lambdaproteobacteria bacterium]|nr:F0F1 ATP synthase subunit gamma [Candidatus Lambdaproteobacteria bacterium]
MTRRRGLEQQLRLFRELMDIMSAMKNLSLTELRKLGRFIETQRGVMETMLRASQDFFSHYPLDLPTRSAAPAPIVLIGSERGFCGGFNDVVLQALERHLRQEAADARSAAGDQTPETEIALPARVPTPPARRVIAVGRRLCQKLADDPRVLAEVEGPALVEEVDEVLRNVLSVLQRHSAEFGANLLTLTVFHHVADSDESSLAIDIVSPVSQFVDCPRRYGAPPLLNVPPDEFMPELIDQYFFAALHEWFFNSLMAENRWRLRHMEGALHRMESRIQQWGQRLNTLRQEEITEEIEEIMLSADAVTRPAAEDI